MYIWLSASLHSISKGPPGKSTTQFCDHQHITCIRYTFTCVITRGNWITNFDVSIYEPFNNSVSKSALKKLLTGNISISIPLIFHNRVTQNFRMNEVSRHNSPHSSNIRATYPFRMPFFHCSNNYSTCPCSTSLCSTCHKTPVKHGLEKQLTKQWG
jgi:hypothetical protein